MSRINFQKYEQVIKDGKPVPAVFAVTVNFKLRVEDVTITTKRQDKLNGKTGKEKKVK